MQTTDTSQTAIDPRHNIVVTASAGSGKTYLLTNRILRLLLEGINPASILAITFTRKAAGEMQTRLLQRARHLLRAEPADLDQSLQQLGLASNDATRSRARHLYQHLLHSSSPPRILTFHAFCQELLQRFPLEAVIPPGFELLETTGVLQEAAWDLLCRSATLEPDTPLAHSLQTLFVQLGSLHSVQQALQGFLAVRSDWWAYSENLPAAVDHAVQQLRALLGDACDSSSDTLISNSLRNNIAAFAVTLGQLDGNTNQQQARHLVDAADLAATAYLAAVWPVFFTQEQQPRQRKLSKTLCKQLGDAAAEQFIEDHQRLCAQLQTLQQQLDIANYAALTQAWYQAGDALLQHYQQLKQQQRCLDFADLEWQSYRLLQNPDLGDWVQFKLDARIDHILLDEFQDTNPTQWLLLKPLLTEIAAGDPERLRSIFLVGDPKQSIYGFRRAKAELQAAASQWLQQQAAAKHITLNKTWRSAPSIIDAVNAVFAGNELLSEFIAHDTHRQQLWGRVEMLPAIAVIENNIASPYMRNPLFSAPPEHQDDRYYREGEQVAARIQALMQASIMVHTESSPRPLNYGDIMILMRRRTHSQAYERALEAAGIPYIGMERGDLLHALEVRDIEALLEFLVSPFSNLALAQVLRSPLFAASHDDLMQLAAADKTSSWYERLLHLPDQQRSAALTRAAQLLPAWQIAVSTLPTHDLLTRIYQDAEVVARYAAASKATTRGRVSANLQRLLELSLDLDSGRYPSLEFFLAHLRKLRANADDAPDSPPSQEQQQARVQLLTIHAAKGLEAPIVILLDSSADENQDNSNTAIVDWPAHSTRPQHILFNRGKATPAAVQTIQQGLRQTQQRENANLLYVAMTRAQHMLIISAIQTSSEKPNWYQRIQQALATLPEAQQDDSGHLWIAKDAQLSTPAAQTPHTNTPQTFTLHVPATKHITWITPSSHDTQNTERAQSTLDRASAQQRGTLIHHCLELLSTPAPLISNPLHHLQRHYPKQTTEQLQAALHEAEAVINNPQFATYYQPEQLQQAWNEVPLHYRNSQQQLISGIIDRLVLTADTLTIIEYKTHQITPREAVELSHQFAPQLHLYAAGIQTLWPKHRLQALVVFTALNHAIPITLDLSAAQLAC